MVIVVDGGNGNDSNGGYYAYHDQQGPICWRGL